MGSRISIFFLLAAALAFGQSPDTVLLVVNQASPLSLKIGQYYAQRRAIPASNICRLRVQPDEEIPRNVYESQIQLKVAEFLNSRGLDEKVLYIVTTAGLPLRIQGTSGLTGDGASVDSELAAVYLDMHGYMHPLNGPYKNPFFGQRTAEFRHPNFPMYLVTRLAGYDFADVKGLIDRALEAKNHGKFVIDLKAADKTQGNAWLRDAAARLPKDRVVLDQSTRVLYSEQNVIGYAGWGSNDPDRKERFLKFQWLPGAIMTEYVSTNARTFNRPPESWNIGDWQHQNTWFAGSPQTMTADYIHEGATGASGHVAEPYLEFNPRPDYLLPAYYQGRNLAESYYLSMPALSWMNIVIGDPLCSLGKP